MTTFADYMNTVIAIAEDCTPEDLEARVDSSEWTFKPFLSRMLVYADPYGPIARADDEVCAKAHDIMLNDVRDAMRCLV